MTSIPGNLLGYVEIDESLLPPGPPGPPGAGIVSQSLTQSLPAGATTSSPTWADTGHSFTITPASATNKIVMRAVGRVGVSGLGTIAYFTWFRAGSPDVDLTPAGKPALDAARILSVDDALHFDTGDLVDVPGVTTPVTYKLMWKVTNPTAKFGGRSSDTIMDVGGSISAMEILA